MRRRGLRDRIRHQRRLTRRLVTRHVLARRAHPAARLLDALGAWFDDDELTGSHRFVPPLVEHDSLSVVADAESAYALTSTAAEPAPDFDELDPTLADDDTTIDAVDLPNAQTAPWPIPEMTVPPRPVAPARRPDPVERARPTPDAIDAGRVAPKPAMPVSPPSAKRYSAPPVRPATSLDRERSARPSTPAVPQSADRPVPIVPRTDSVAARSPIPPLDAPAPRAPDRPSVSATRSAQNLASAASTSDAATAETSDAAETAARPTPNADDVVVSRESAASAPTVGASESSSHQVSENARTAEPPTAPAESPVHSEVLQRALGALRASGELPPAKGQPAVRREPPAVHPASAPVPVPPARPVPTPSTPPSRAAAPRPVDRKADAAPTATPARLAASARLTANNATPYDRSSTDEPLTDAPPASAKAQPPSAGEAPEATDASQSVTASPVEQTQLAAPATQDATPRTRDSAVESQSAPTPESEAVAAPPDQRRIERSPTLSPGLRVDEQRQARRPSHLDRVRSDAPASTPASASQPPRDTSPPLSRGPDRSANAGQFQFADVERTVQDWQRLLFEATNPPRPGARREPPRAPENRATAKAPPAPPVKPNAAPSAARSVPPGATRTQPVPDRADQRPIDAAARPAPNALPRQAATSQSARTPIDDPAVPIAANEPIAPPSDTGPAVRAADVARSAPEPQPESPLTPAAVAEEMRAMPTEPVAPSTRRFLRPLVGVDPDSVRIHRGERAARLADLHDADAIAVGDDIAIGAGHDERDPETIALLAHELTHAARARDRRFVPPVARGGRATTLSSPDTSRPARGGVRQTSRPSASIDAEETLAEGVEARVRDAASHQREREQTFTVTPNADLDDAVDLPLDDEAEGDASIGLSATSGHPPGRPGTPATRSGDARRSPWGSLPAPWEPLPAALLASRSASTGSVASAPVVSADPPASAESAESPPVVHRAARGSGSAGEEPAHAEHPAQAAAAPDIDALARQVYSVLKRRLAAESRRGA